MNRLRIMMIGAALIAGSSMIASAQPRDERRDWGYADHNHDRDKRYPYGIYGRDRDDRDDHRKVYDRDDRARHERDERWETHRVGDRDHDGDRR